MKKNLLEILCCPFCKEDLKLDVKKILINGNKYNKAEEVIEGILICQKCSREYPIIDGIPRLCIKLLEDENKISEKLRIKNDIKIGKQKVRNYDVYMEIEKRIRHKVKHSPNESEYLKMRIENDINYRVIGCEKQEKYINTLNLYYNGKIKSFLDVGGGQGGLTKCFNELLNPSISIILDFDISWLEIAKLRNPKADIIRGNAIRLPFKKGSINIVFSQAMLEHIQGYDDALREMCEVTKDILFVCWNPNRFFLYDFGHLDAPITILPKSMAKCVFRSKVPPHSGGKYPPIPFESPT